MLYTDRLAITGPKLDNFAFPGNIALLVVGDVHGQNAALRGVLTGLGRVATPGKHRVLVFLGDLIDRGPDSLGCLNTAFFDAGSLAKADEVIFLPGNHELLLADAFIEARAGAAAMKHPRASNGIWAMNGGYNFMLDTYEAMGQDMPNSSVDMMLKFHDMLPHPGFDTFDDMVRSWPSHVRLGDVLCVHAGLLPKKPHAFTLDLDQKSHNYYDIADRDVSKRHWAWVRDAFLEWQSGWPATGEKDDEHGCLVLHGHTVPTKARSSHLVDGASVADVFSRMETNGRVCLDGGAARDVGVAAAVVADGALRVLFEPT